MPSTFVGPNFEKNQNKIFVFLYLYRLFFLPTLFTYVDLVCSCLNRECKIKALLKYEYTPLNCFVCPKPEGWSRWEGHFIIGYFDLKPKWQVIFTVITEDREGRVTIMDVIHLRLFDWD